MWFLVPSDPVGNVHGVDTAKVEWTVVGMLLAAVWFFLSRYFLRKAAHENLGKENVNNV
jgi:hypothetical protein